MTDPRSTIEWPLERYERRPETFERQSACYPKVLASPGLLEAPSNSPSPSLGYQEWVWY